MANTVTFKVNGLDNLRHAFNELKQEVKTKVSRSMTNASAQLVKRAAVKNIIRSPSVVTGSLRDAVIVKRETKTQLTSEHLVTVRRKKTGSEKSQAKQSTAPHAIYVEFGTKNMPEEPFLEPAITNNARRAADAMAKTGKKKIEAAARKANRGKL